MVYKMAAVNGVILNITRSYAFYRKLLPNRNIALCVKCVSKRFYAFSLSNVMNIFDRNAKRHQRNVAAKMPDHHVYDYLKDEVS